MSDIKEFLAEQRGETNDFITDKFLDILAERIKDLDEQVATERAVNWGAMDLIDKLDKKLVEYEDEIDALEHRDGFVPDVFKIQIELEDLQLADFRDAITSQGFRVLNYHSIQGVVNFFGKAAYPNGGRSKFVFYVIADELWLDSMIDILDGAKI